MCLFPFAFSDGGENARRTTTNRINNKASSQEAVQGSSVGGCACLFVVFLWAGGSVGLVLARKKLNTDFMRRNTIRLNYSLSHDKAIRYKRLLRCLDDVAPAKLFEIVACESSVYEESKAASFRIALPRFLDCNYDVYCLAVGRDRYYLLPDCALVFTDGEFFTVSYGKISLSINNISGYLRITVFDYHWAHARVDGGPDRRFKHNYQIRVPRKTTVPLHQYGVMAFRIGRDKFAISTDNATLLPAFNGAFQKWLQIQ
jgi:hypothetical protein